MSFDLPAIRAQFPALSQHGAYLDFGATALMPQPVMDAMNDYERSYRANVHRGLYEASAKASELYEEARATIAQFLGVTPPEIVFTSGTTMSLNVAARILFESPHITLNGTTVLASDQEHHANFIPWQQLSKRHGYTFKQWNLNDHNAYQDAAILAVSTTSNVLGNHVDVAAFKDPTSSLPSLSGYLVVDLAQSVMHAPTDLASMRADVAACSGHKLYGPTGVGVLFVRKELHKDIEPVVWGGGMIESVTEQESRWAPMPERLEPGTPPIAQAIGLKAAIEWIQSIGFDAIQAHEHEIMTYALERLDEIRQVTIVGSTDPHRRHGALSFVINGIHAHDVAQVLADHRVAVRAGHHCAMPLHTSLDLPATVRASIGIPTSKEDIDMLIAGIHAAIDLFA